MELNKKLEKYFALTKEALQKAEKSTQTLNLSKVKKARADFLDMAKRYFSDAQHFQEKGDNVNAFAAVCYAHAFLDAGARLGLFNVKDSRLFMVD
tara:strand:+ start:1267 stop:1551 length:285 start_codon:yes stop_codon:yes gene_type:complete